MTPTTIACDSRDSTGRLCGATAEVRRIHYKYVPQVFHGEVEQVLSETHYDIECPRCGWRTQIEKAEMA